MLYKVAFVTELSSLSLDEVILSIQENTSDPHFYLFTP